MATLVLPISKYSIKLHTASVTARNAAPMKLENNSYNATEKSSIER